MAEIGLKMPKAWHSHLPQVNCTPMKQRLLQQLDRLGREQAAGPAVRDADGRSIAWGELRAAVGAMAHHLRSILPSGSVVLLVSPNRSAFHVGFLGALLADFSVFPVSPQLTAVELASAAMRSQAAAVLGTSCAKRGLGDVSPRWVELDNVFEATSPPADEVDAAFAAHTGTGSLLLLSSGTTGMPKIVQRSAASLDAVAVGCVEAIGVTSEDVILAVAPLHHSYGLEHGLLMPVMAGAAVELLEQFDPEQVINRATDGPASILPGVPFLFEAIVQMCRVQHLPLRKVYSAGGPLPRSVFETFERDFGLKIGQVFGSTEVGSVTFSDPAAASFAPGSVGQPMRGVEIRILDRDEPNLDRPLPCGQEGTVAVRAPSMLDGYLDGECEMFRDGYFFTGDLGKLSRTGNLTVTGRTSLLINVGGRKVNPREVELVLMEHPAVREAVVVPVAVTETVSRLKAVIVPETSAGAALDDATLREFARQRLSAYKVPRVFEMRAALPRSGMGKVLHEAIK